MLEQIVTPLLSWYDKHARVLPWREDTAAYRVWVSEIMLQQTRVEAVKPFFERFIKALPDVQALSEAPEDELLKLWEGLGYYNRVRNMQKAARVIVSEYSGDFPADYEKLFKPAGAWTLHSRSSQLYCIWHTHACGGWECITSVVPCDSQL